MHTSRWPHGRGTALGGALAYGRLRRALRPRQRCARAAHQGNSSPSPGVQTAAADRPTSSALCAQSSSASVSSCASAFGRETFSSYTYCPPRVPASGDRASQTSEPAPRCGERRKGPPMVIRALTSSASRSDVGHQHQVGDVLVNWSASARRPGFCGDELHPPGLSADERDLDALRRDLDRGGLADAAGRARQEDQSHAGSLYLAHGRREIACLGSRGSRAGPTCVEPYSVCVDEYLDSDHVSVSISGESRNRGAKLD
jgi:hypothetical protein